MRGKIMSMTPRARVEKVVKKATAVPGSFGQLMLDNAAIVTLLLREHRRVIGVIKRNRDNAKPFLSSAKAGGWRFAHDDLLAALRGKR